MESTVSRGPDIYKKIFLKGTIPQPEHNLVCSILNYFVAAVTTDKLFHNSHLTDKEKVHPPILPFYM